MRFREPPLFSGQRSVHLATVDILIVWATIVGMNVAIWPHYKWVTVAQLPYFIWGFDCEHPAIEHHMDELEHVKPEGTNAERRNERRTYLSSGVPGLWR